MWWSRLLTLLAVLALGPAGCGFHPLYAKSEAAGESAVRGEMAQVRIGLIENRLGQQLRNALLERITPAGEPADPSYTLSVKLSESETSLGYRRDSFATLGLLIVTAAVSLGPQGLIRGEAVTATVSFDYLGPRYASVAMERDAEERAIQQLADQISQRVGLALKAGPAAGEALRR
jgi:LPS-assembly lipoprotein